MAEEDTSKDLEDTPEDTAGDTLDAVEDPEDSEEGDDPEVPEPAPATDASGPPRRLGRPGRTAAIAVGAALAIAAVAVGAAWAIVAIADDDDRSTRDEQRFDAAGAAIRDDDRREQFDRERRERQERREQAQRERDERMERLEELKREREQRSDRLEELKRERQERLDDAPQDGSARPGKHSTEGCRTILSLGEGDDALTVLICNLPQAEPWPFEPGFEDEFEPGDGFEFRRGPRDLAPLFEMFEMFENFRGFDGFDFERFEDFEGFEGRDGIPWRGRDGWPFGRGQWPFGADGEGGFPDGGRGFWFDGQDGDRGNGIERFCFGENGAMACFGDGEGFEELDQLSEEQLRELDEWMESFRQFGPGRFLEEFLEDYLGGTGLQSRFQRASSGLIDA
ncbi:MAG: hypothetical protein OXG66_01945 [Acidimicrobiaceae bacterium]|nr:hypothetical protein [Acidimicrobiaceae bacterium]